jgi:hypothetical protein
MIGRGRRQDVKRTPVIENPELDGAHDSLKTGFDLGCGQAA